MKQYFETVDVKDLPTDKTGKCFVIDSNGDVDYHYCDYVRRHPEKYVSWLRPVDLREVAGKSLPDAKNEV